jgi:hypothetical protein
VGHTINQNPTTCIINVWNERVSNSENLGERITEFGVTVAKIWRNKVIGTYL